MHGTVHQLGGSRSKQSVVVVRHGVLQPVHVIALLEVLARVRSARLLAGLGGDHGAVRLLEQVLELEGLDEVGVPDHGAVGDDGLKIEGMVKGGGLFVGM